MPDTQLYSQDIIDLGHDLHTVKLYWVSIFTLFFYDYFITLPQEIRYAWKGRKTPVFFLYFWNRYIPACFIIINMIGYFSDAWTSDVYVYSSLVSNDPFIIFWQRRCKRYSFMKPLEIMITTFASEVLLTIRVFAISGRKYIVILIAGSLMAVQWGIILYVSTRSSQATDHLTALLKHQLVPPPQLPNSPIYHMCFFIPILVFVPWIEAHISLFLAFDVLVFLAIIAITVQSSRGNGLYSLMGTIQRDGIMYFFILLSSNLTWLLLTLYARPALKFLHIEPTVAVTSIMINRITLNLKRAADNETQASWSVRTFETPGQGWRNNFLTRNNKTQRRNPSSSDIRFRSTVSG